MSTFWEAKAKVNTTATSLSNDTGFKMANDSSFLWQDLQKTERILMEVHSV